MKVYLCGPINGCTDEECKDWREYVKTQLPDTIDPMRRDYRGREDDFVQEIIWGDKLDIRASDALLVMYDKPSVGTSMEVMYAWQEGKTIVVVAPKGARISPWLKFHSNAIVHSLDRAIELILEEE